MQSLSGSLRFNTVEIDGFLLIIEHQALIHILRLTLDILCLVKAVFVLHAVDDVALIHHAVSHAGGLLSESLTGHVIDLLLEHVLDLALAGGDILTKDGLHVVASHVSESRQDPEAALSFGQFLVLDNLLDNIGVLHHLDVCSHAQDLEGKGDELDHRYETN